MRSVKTALCLVPLLLVATSHMVAQQQLDRLTLDLYLEWESVSDPRISPDGEQVIYTRRWIDKMSDRWESSLWIMNVDGSRNRFLTEGSSPRWSPDGTRIAFLRQGDPEGTQVFVRWMDAEGAVTQITHVDKGPGSLRWSPDGKWIAFTMSVEAKSAWSVKLPPRPGDTNNCRLPKCRSDAEKVPVMVSPMVKSPHAPPPDVMLMAAPGDVLSNSKATTLLIHSGPGRVGFLTRIRSRHEPFSPLVCQRASKFPLAKIIAFPGPPARSSWYSYQPLISTDWLMGGRSLQMPFSNWSRLSVKVFVTGCQVAPPLSLTSIRYLRRAAPLEMSGVLPMCPVMITSPPKGLSWAVKPASNAGPLARPRPFTSPTSMLPTVSMFGKWVPGRTI